MLVQVSYPHFFQDCTVDDVKRLIEARTGIPPNEQRLLFEAKQLVDGKKLCEYSIRDNSTIFLVMRLPGGAKRPSPPVQRKVDPSVPRSKRECMIMFTNDDNVKMPCGHTISPDALIDHSWNEICVNRKTQVQCCLCSKNWDPDIIRRYGGATDKEIAILQECMSANYCQKDPKISECPSCYTICERQNESNQCVMCRICTKKKGKSYHFCWECKREWIGSVTNSVCGNANCNPRELLEKLKNCPMKKMDYFEGVYVPSFRACPCCGCPIEHAGECKHMQCRICSKEFCFVCLRIRVGGSWPCGIYRDPCHPAPRQTTIPRRN